ncbi:MAG: class I tRNA ligase family protein [Pirellulales bacterium]
MFRSVPPNVSFPQLETDVIAFWRERGIYDKSLRQRQAQHESDPAGHPRFVFYEGPPTANGMPHPGHCLTRAIKDLFPRYRTMRGEYCERKAGWDTHGLPVEVEVCKELGIHSKEEIEAFGIEPFIQKCQQSVWRYMQEWERLTERIGFWIHLDEAYVTYHQRYVESVWWSLKNLFDRGLLYQGHKIVWWWAQGGTALSAGEVGQGYRQVADPSVYVKFPLLDDDGKVTDTSLLVWTTTPWTLPSNQFAAVDPELEYSVVVDSETGEKLVIASALVDTIAGKVRRELVVEATIQGRELIKKRFIPPFEDYYRQYGSVQGRIRHPSQMPDALWTLSSIQYLCDQGYTGEEAAREIKSDTKHLAWRIVGAKFVTTDSGTGVVHIAPAFGEVDYNVLMKEGATFGTQGDEVPMLCCVAPDGKFTDEGPEYCRGRWVKDCDKDITRDLKQRGLLYHLEQYLHDYPFCWRAEGDPLIQYPRESWFIKTTEFKDAMLANNAEINWLPEHIRDGRFGNFLESNVDWALSRERYWGTPLPIWVCDKTGAMEAIGSYEELLAQDDVQGTEVWDAAKRASPALPDDLRVHKPYIDAVTYKSKHAEGARMRRVTEVIDCWYDSGAMPFAQWGYRGEDGPQEAAAEFREQFPADFISEALDQTRGWFYSQLAISTMLFGNPHLAPGDSPGAMRSTSKTNATSPNDETPNLQPPAPFPHPFKNCIVLGLMLGEDGQKMSKSKRNYREPGEIFDKYGADALRWYFFANQPPWTGIRYSEQAIKDSVPEFLLRLWNCYSFFVIYANIDGFDPAEKISGDVHDLTTDVLARATDYRPIQQRRPLDRWIIGELDRAASEVTSAMNLYDSFGACRKMLDLVDGLSNWYVRRARDRFWSSDKTDPDKLDAYWTLYECLLTTTKLIAPFTPFLAETIWQNIAVEVFGSRTIESVHFAEYPTGDFSHPRFDADRERFGKMYKHYTLFAGSTQPNLEVLNRFDGNLHNEVKNSRENPLSEEIQLVREISSLGRSARMIAKLKVRQPLSKVEIVLADEVQKELLRAHDENIRDELNVKQVEYTTHGEQYITYQVLPNFKRLGPRVGKHLPALKKALGEADGAKLLADMNAAGKIALTIGGEAIELDGEDIEVRLQAKPGWAAAQGKQCVVVLSTELTDELIQEGIAKDLVRAIQDRRKDIACEYTARIEVSIATTSEPVRAAIAAFAEYIQGETLAAKLHVTAEAISDAAEVTVADEPVRVSVRVVK